jgi:hypothetical protein
MTLVQTGVRESVQSWHELLIDIKQRGLEIAPAVARIGARSSLVSFVPHNWPRRGSEV